MALWLDFELLLPFAGTRQRLGRLETESSFELAFGKRFEAAAVKLQSGTGSQAEAGNRKYF